MILPPPPSTPLVPFPLGIRPPPVPATIAETARPTTRPPASRASQRPTLVPSGDDSSGALPGQC